ncbi:MAG: hypothetical protein NZM05_07270 [Chloroherpetonaceae bacterium]|nr:hypothetical protein [Chloroherpetonaceae bacterium]
MSDTRPIYEKVADRLIGHLGDLSELSYSALQLLPFPLLFKNIFFAELRREAREELRRFKSERFLFGHSSLEPYRNALADAATATAVLSREECIKLIRRTARLQGEYLERPQHFLCKHLYAESYELSAEAIRQALSPFTEYQYLTEVLLQYLSRKRVASLSDERFEKLIADIDRKVCATYNSAEWAYLLEPLYAYYSLGGELRVPISVLQVFLREKDALSALSALMHLREHGIDALAHSDIALLFEGSVEELLRKKKSLSAPPEFKETLVAHLSRQLAEEALSKSTETVPQVAALSNSPSTAQHQSERLHPSQALATTDSPDAVTASASEVKTPTDLQVAAEAPLQAALEPTAAEEKDLHARLPQSKVEIDKQKTEPATAEASNKAKDPEAAIPTSANRDQGAAAMQPNAPQSQANYQNETTLLPTAAPARPAERKELADLRALITLSDRKKIIKRVFKGSEVEYEKAISELNQKKTWREASIYLDQEVFKRFNVDEYSTEAVLLTDTVFERHSRKP